MIVNEQDYLTLYRKDSVINEEDYLAHYGRKGMKWYQHIFGDYQKGAKYAKRSGTSDTPTSTKSKSSGSSNSSSNPKSRFKTDEESDKAFASRVKLDPDHGPDDDSFSDLIEEIREKSGDVTDGYARSAVSEAYRKNREAFENFNENIFPNLPVSKAADEATKAYQDYIRKNDRNPFVDPFKTKEGKALQSKKNEASEKSRSAYRQYVEKLDDELYGIILKDLGYRDTAKSRKRLKELLSWYD